MAGFPELKTALQTLSLTPDEVELDVIFDISSVLINAGEIYNDAVVDIALQRLQAYLPEVSKNPVRMTQAMLVLACLIALKDGKFSGLRLLTQAFVDVRFQEMDADLAYALLYKNGWMDSLNEETLLALTEGLGPAYQVDDEHGMFVSYRMIRFFGFNVQTNLELLRPFYEAVALPWLKEALSTGFYSTALYIEENLYSNWLRRNEVMDHYDEHYRRWVPEMEEAGLAVRSKIGAVAPEKGKRPRIGIFVHNASWIAHIQTLHQSFKGLTERPYDVCIYFFAGYSEEAERKFREINIECMFLSKITTDEKNIFLKLLLLRRTCEKDGVNVMIWLCLASMMGFSYGMQLAPRQIYWCMKYNVGAFSVVDDYFMSFNFTTPTVDVFGKTWNIIPVSYTSSKRPSQSAIDKLRAQYEDNKIILGSVCREDKLNSQPFLDAVCEILQKNPETIYLYTGRTNLPAIQNHFAQHNLSGRVFYIGWIDARLYCEIFDVYLDSWPARSGLTAFNAMEAGKPCIAFTGDTGQNLLVSTHYGGINLVEDEQGDLHFPRADIDAMFDRKNMRCLPAVTNAANYVTMATRLINDTKYRAACGEVAQEFAAFLADETRVTQALDAHLKSNLLKAGVSL